jgi:hypothetical protein
MGRLLIDARVTARLWYPLPSLAAGDPPGFLDNECAGGVVFFCCLGYVSIIGLIKPEVIDCRDNPVVLASSDVTPLAVLTVGESFEMDIKPAACGRVHHVRWTHAGASW